MRCGVCGCLSGWFGAGWYPGMAVEQGAEGVEFADAPFGGGGQVGLDDGEVGEPVDGAPASSGAALLDLDRADGALCFVVRSRCRLRVVRVLRSIRIGCG